MFDRLMSFLQSLSGETSAPEPDSVVVAIVALALHVVQADGIVRDVENDVLEAAIRSYFNLSKGEFDTMLKAARREEEDAIDLFGLADWAPGGKS